MVEHRYWKSICCALHTDDSDYIGFGGTYLKGRQEIASLHQMFFDKFIKSSRPVGKI